MVNIPEYTPKLDELGTNTTWTPVYPSEAGAPYEAISHLGGNLAAFSSNLLEKRQAAEDKDFAYQRAMQDARDLEKYQQELKLKMPDDMKGYSDAVQKWINDRFQQNQKDAPTNGAKEQYQQHTMGLFNQAIIESRKQEFTSRASSYITNITDNADQNGSTLISNPNISLAEKMLDITDKHIDESTGVIVSSDQADKLKQVNSNSVAKGLLDGLYSHGLGDPRAGKAYFQQGLDLLNGTPQVDETTGQTVMGSHRVVDGLSASEKASYVDKFSRALKENQSFSNKELMARYRDNVTKAYQGVSQDPTLFTDLRFAVGDKPGQISKDDFERLKDTYNSAWVGGQMIKDMKVTNPSEWQGMFGKWQSKMDAIIDSDSSLNPDLKAIKHQPTFNAADRENSKEEIMRQAQVILKARSEDPVQYISDNFPALRTKMVAAGNDPNAVDRTIKAYVAQQDQLGIPRINQRVLSKSDTTSIATALNGNDPQQVANAFTLFQNKYGAYWQDAFNELMSDKRMDESRRGLWLAAGVTDPVERKNVVANVINKDAIEEAYKKSYSNPAERKSLDDAVSDQISSYYKALSVNSADGGSLQYANGMHDVVSNEAKKIMITSAGKMTPEEAAKNALQIVNRQHTLVTAAGSSVLVPNQINGHPVDPKLVSSFMESHLKPDALKEFNPKIPANTDAEKFLQNVSDRGLWVMGSSPDRMRIRIEWNGQRGDLLGQNGLPLEFKIRDINEHPDKRTLQQSKPTLLKLWEGIKGVFGGSSDNSNPGPAPTSKPTPSSATTPEQQFENDTAGFMSGKDTLNKIIKVNSDARYGGKQ